MLASYTKASFAHSADILRVDELHVIQIRPKNVICKSAYRQNDSGLVTVRSEALVVSIYRDT
jgi:hypothetical protein